MGAWAHENGVQFVSLFPVFVNQESADQIIQKYYWKNDAHWNEEGHRLVAEALCKQREELSFPPNQNVSDGMALGAVSHPFAFLGMAKVGGEVLQNRKRSSPHNIEAGAES